MSERRLGEAIGSVAFVAQIVTITLKLAKVVDWPWWPHVLLPTILPFLIIFVVVAATGLWRGLAD